MENKKGRPKGGKNKYWSADEKYKVIKPIIKYEKTSGLVPSFFMPFEPVVSLGFLEP